MKNKPIAVISGDIHFTVPTLELATIVVQQAKAKALELGVPLILNGDILDSKAIVRGECMNRLLELIRDKEVDVIINVGNHDLISEKGTEHVLNFLRPYCTLVDRVMYIDRIKSYIIPYINIKETLEGILSQIPSGSRLIMHQGVNTAHMGHYAIDRTSLQPSFYANFRVIASHYHKAQDIKCGEVGKNLVGLFSYIGNPYTLSFGEAEDGPKGYSILFDDGSLELVPLNLRRHRICNINVGVHSIGPFTEFSDITKEDLVWIKATGTKSDLDTLDKHDLGMFCVGHSNYKLEKIYPEQTKMEAIPQKSSDYDVFDSIINTLDETPEHKEYLKKTWRELL